MSLTVCPVSDTITQRGTMMSSFETQQFTLRTENQIENKNISNFSVIILLKVELVLLF